jgi:hypothetical protein
MQNKIELKLIADIVKYCEENIIEVDWDNNDRLNDDSIGEIIENQEDWEDEMTQMNFEHTYKLENYFIEETLIPLFGKKIEDLGEDYDIKDYLRQHVLVDMNFPALYKREDIVCTITMYSNYDCTNSFDTMESSEYLSQVFKRLNRGITKKDFMYVHREGAYGGSLFVFVFKMNLFEFMKLKDEMIEKNPTHIVIPKGMQYGFYSSFQGSSSFFGNKTQKEFKIKIKETGKEYHPEYDHASIECNDITTYSIEEIFGQTDWVQKQKIKLV